MTWLSRAQPMMGTWAIIDIPVETAPQPAKEAVTQAFSALAHVSRIMSAHDPASDLGRISRSQAGARLKVDMHTVRVLKIAQHWERVSGGAINPVLSAMHLQRRGLRPGLDWSPRHGLSLDELSILSETEIHLHRPLSIDLGGIAKGHAIDLACEVLHSHGIDRARVNAGGDLRLIGHGHDKLLIRHARDQLRDAHAAPLKPKANMAYATSAAHCSSSEFVTIARHHPASWRGVTVMAPLAVTADALTKWALQSSLLCPKLRQVMRLHGARMWRSA